MAIEWDIEETTQPSGVDWGDSSNTSSMTLDASQAALSQSQKWSDMLRQTEEANKQAATLSSPMGIAKETGKGVLNTLVGAPFRAIGSAIQGVKDLTSGSISTEPIAKDFLGQPVQSYQGGLKSGESPLSVGLDVASILPVGKALTAVKPLAKFAAPLTRPITSYLAKRAEKKAFDASVDAVYSSPTGAKFKKTSGQVLTGQRELTPASMFREQGLTPDQQTVNLATRLKELKLGKDPVKNTQILADDFVATESKLQNALKGDPNIVYSGDRENLIRTLNKVRKESPQEFRIKESASMVDNVVTFANRIVGKSEDSIGGIRETRKAFDAQAKREFPNAFKPDGTIDTKTPAGYAIKKVRDDINEHLYNTAPNGSEIQGLIGREADLYRAAQVSLEKALKGQGKTSLQQWAKENPGKATLLGFGVTGVAGGIGGAAYGAFSR